MTINVMIIDDSAVMRQTLSRVLNEAPDIQVSQTASDPVIAQLYLKREKPDVIVLDIEMPRMDGITFLQQLMASEPIPVVICSSLTSKGCHLSVQALAAGAIDVIAKPTTGLNNFIIESQQKFWQAVRTAARVRSRAMVAKPPAPALAQAQSTAWVTRAGTTDYVIAIGTSTGGTQALELVLSQLPRTTAGIVIVQHMPEKFTTEFAKRLNTLSELDVLEAQGGERVIPGRALLAPGGCHLEVIRSGAQFVARVFRGPSVNRHCPSVDVLFNSVASNVGRSATGVIMTGMGDDGAKGLLKMKNCGADTIAQDEQSSIVFGMPREAISLGAANTVCSLQAMAQAIHQSAQRRQR
ncbi:MAG TPA: chemotaxis response regulator protein-glutamate methylesterase [Marinagarivorans sp.]